MRPPRLLLPTQHTFHLPLRRPHPPLTHTHLPITPSRPASHASQGRANKAAQGPGKRLGAKKSQSQYVVPGNIIFRQRGTSWYPGENTAMGRDHCIYATQKGYVVYYEDKEGIEGTLGRVARGKGGCKMREGMRVGRKGRRYIGVTFERGEVLPRGRGQARRRRLGLEVCSRAGREGVGTGEVKEGEGAGEVKEGKEGEDANVVAKAPKQMFWEKGKMALRRGGIYRETNAFIGRAAEREGVKVIPYQPGDRWAAWRKRTDRRAKAKEKRALRAGSRGPIKPKRK